MIRAKTASRLPRPSRVRLFDLGNAQHDASHSAFAHINDAMMSHIVERFELSRDESSRLGTHDWHRYGATLLGLIKHHGVQAGQFLAQAHQNLKERVRATVEHPFHVV